MVATFFRATIFAVFVLAGRITSRGKLGLILVLLSCSTQALATCTATAENFDVSPQDGTTATLTANINAKGDLVVFAAWCYFGSGNSGGGPFTCTSPTVIMGGQKAAPTTVSGPPDTAVGQIQLFYILSAAASGQQTITFSASGTYNETQIAYYDFTPSAGCTFLHDVDSPLGSGTGSTTINSPSITPSGAGEVLFNFSATSGHMTGVNSPWVCNNYPPSETGTCQFISTVNEDAYILSSSAGATTNNVTTLHSTDTWDALLTSFSMSGSGASTPNPPTNLTVTVH